MLKTEPEKYKKSRKFLKYPQVEGGKQGFIKFIKENLQYPKEAIEAKIEGSVLLWVEISDEGKLLQTKIEKGLGYGCDEEALRLVKLLKYEKARNRNVRVKSKNKIRIDFKLQKIEQQLSYTISLKNNAQKAETDKNKKTTYGYTISY